MEVIILFDNFNKTYMVGDPITGSIQVACKDPSVELQYVILHLTVNYYELINLIGNIFS
ncbi:MAG: hypothetical protein MJ252_11665 [archaeon]|nr:hypothetical protein [archaeon]